MGYTTYFTGQFSVTPTLKPEHAKYLRALAETRRMSRDAKIAETFADPIRLAVNLPIGDEGAYYVGSFGQDMGQVRDASIVNYNIPPSNQPSLWNHWVPTDDGNGIEQDGGEKFYEYVTWIEYIVSHFLRAWGYTLSGHVSWQGEDSDDRGIIYAKENQVEAVVDRITNAGPNF